MHKAGRTAMLTVMAMVSGAAGLAGQQSPGGQAAADAILKAANGRFAPAFCLPIMKSSDKAGRVTAALKTGIEDKDPAKRAKALEDAEKAGRDLVKSDAKSVAGWYYLGRTGLLRGEAGLADSALTQAETLANDPSCVQDITTLRQTAWVAVTNGALDLVNGGKSDEGIAWLRTSNLLYRGMPQAFAAMGAAFSQVDKADSSIVYFQKAAEIAAADTSLTQERNRNTFNLGLMLQRANRHEEAVAAFQKFLGWVPGDVNAKKALAQSYRATGKSAEAAAIDKELLSSAGTGAGAGAAGGDNAVTANDLFNIGVGLFNDKKYAEAADAFGKVLVSEPNNREALFNQANAYLGAGNAKGLVAAAQQLLKREPLNESNHKLLIQGLRDDGQQDALLKAAEAFLGTPVNVEVKNMSKAGITGIITGREAKDLKGNVLKPAAVELAFELYDNAGTVVATQSVAVAALPAGQTQEFKVESGGKAFTGYRYTRK